MFVHLKASWPCRKLDSEQLLVSFLASSVSDAVGPKDAAFHILTKMWRTIQGFWASLPHKMLEKYNNRGIVEAQQRRFTNRRKRPVDESHSSPAR